MRPHLDEPLSRLVEKAPVESAEPADTVVRVEASAWPEGRPVDGAEDEDSFGAGDAPSAPAWLPPADRVPPTTTPSPPPGPRECGSWFAYSCAARAIPTPEIACPRAQRRTR